MFPHVLYQKYTKVQILNIEINSVLEYFEPYGRRRLGIIGLLKLPTGLKQVIFQYFLVSCSFELQVSFLASGML